MTYSSFNPPPGMVNDGTNYAAKGRWFTGDKVRFRSLYPEKIKGWVKYSPSPMLGMCRNIHSWTTIAGNRQSGINTNIKNYVMSNGGTPADVTPIRITTTLGTNPFATAVGTNVITVTAPSHGAQTGDYVTFSGVTATVFGGVTGTTLNGNWQITFITNNSYSIVIPTTATSNASGGGAAVVAAYENPVGLATRVTSAGYGAGSYGGGAYGGPASTTVLGPQIRIWSSDNFGEDLIFCQRQGNIYYWSNTNAYRADGRGVALSAIAGGSNQPTIANWVLIGPQSRQVFAFGANPIGSATQDPLFIRWSDLESATLWTPAITNAAGSLRLSLGSEIYCAHIATGQILVWTDSSLHALLYVGGDLGYGQNVLSPNVDIISPNSATTFGNFAIWMGRENFYLYDGTVKTMPCSVREAVFGNINLDQSFKVYASTNSLYREVWFFYPSNTATENDSYVVYNYVDDVWFTGTINRTAWADNGTEQYPTAYSTDGYLYYHETGLDDGSTTPPTPIDAYIESGPVELEDGDKFIFVSRIIPDITFSESTTQFPSVVYTVTPKDYPGGPYYNSDALPVTNTTSITVEQFTQYLPVRIRGRHFVFRVESSGQAGVWWRLGKQRFNSRTDGQR